jgi:hypothetical protein
VFRPQRALPPTRGGHAHVNQGFSVVFRDGELPVICHGDVQSGAFHRVAPERIVAPIERGKKVHLSRARAIHMSELGG